MTLIPKPEMSALTAAILNREADTFIREMSEVNVFNRPNGSMCILNPLKKCLLNGCDEMTTHNGGYCCAEHCKQDALKQRKESRG